ncbi:hypothetical protein [Clostridium beijerinckii]|uniref:hypothetical protein n=1 Tax=Clostridium beijerinckii TaxID=1520 RepID=UPI000B174350|nr:hypothetical protein [Clostridium beijerinckii]
MGNIIKINIYYAEFTRKNKDKLRLETVEKSILKYDKWIKDTNRKDNIETYEEFLRVQ